MSIFKQWEALCFVDKPMREWPWWVLIYFWLYLTPIVFVSEWVYRLKIRFNNFWRK